MLPLLAVALVSAGALAFEVLLTRLFSIIQWHHFAYMVISIALLGYGASGAFLAVTATVYAVMSVPLLPRELSCLRYRPSPALPWPSGCLYALAVIWEPRQLLYLLVLYLLFALPFFWNTSSIWFSRLRRRPIPSGPATCDMSRMTYDTRHQYLAGRHLDRLPGSPLVALIAGTDCGLGGRVHAELAWAKLRALVEGAQLASKNLWRR